MVRRVCGGGLYIIEGIIERGVGDGEGIGLVLVVGFACVGLWNGYGYRVLFMLLL